MYAEPSRTAIFAKVEMKWGDLRATKGARGEPILAAIDAAQRKALRASFVLAGLKPRPSKAGEGKGWRPEGTPLQSRRKKSRRATGGFCSRRVRDRVSAIAAPHVKAGQKEAVMSSNPAAPAPELKIETERTPTEATVRCTGRITSFTSDSLKSTVRPLIPESKCVVLDLTNVSFLDSSGLGTIVGLWVTSKKSNCQLKLTNANQRIVDLFIMSNLSRILEGHEDYLGVTPD
jgi:anti-sigma B factor antagonist